MSEISKNIVSLIVSKEFHKAKTLIREAMNNKLGLLLEEKLLEYGPTLHEDRDSDRQDILDYLKTVAPVTNTRPPRNAYYRPSVESDKIQKATDTANSVAHPAMYASAGADLLHSIPAVSSGAIVNSMNLGINRGIPTAYAVGKIGMNTAEVAAKATNLIPRPVQKVVSSVLGGTAKLWKPLMIGKDIIDVANTSMHDTDWKDKPGTAAATLGVDIAKHAALTAPWLLPIAKTGVIGVGAVIGTTIAQGVNRGIDAIAGTDLADLQFQRDTYDPKKIVQGVKAVVSSKEDIEKETQSEVDEFKKEVESSGRGQAVRDADVEGAKITAKFDSDQKKK